VSRVGYVVLPGIGQYRTSEYFAIYDIGWMTEKDKLYILQEDLWLEKIFFLYEQLMKCFSQGSADVLKRMQSAESLVAVVSCRS